MNNLNVISNETQEFYQADNNISFSKFTDTDNKTAKSYEVLGDNLVKSTCGSFWNGFFQTISLPYADLPDFIKSMRTGEFIVQGVHQTLTSGGCPTDATRRKELFPFSDNAGLMCIDTDSINEFNNISCIDDLITAFHGIESNLKPVFMFCSSSASSFVEYGGVSSCLKGVHTFLPIDKATEIPRVLECLHVRSVIAGYGYPKITKCGTIKINSLIDTALKTSNQPIFEGGAILKNDAITQNCEHILYDGKILHSNTIRHLTDKEMQQYDCIVQKLKDSVSAEAAKIRSEYLQNTGKILQNKCSALSSSYAKNIAKRAAENLELYGQFIVLLETGLEISVQSILDDPKHFHEIPCAHPLDFNILGKSIIYSDQKTPVIHSFAHGRDIFYLQPNTEEWKLKLKDHVECFNATHAQVIMAGKHKIMRDVSDHLHQDKLENYEFFNVEELKKIYGNDLIQVGEKMQNNVLTPVYKDKITAWTHHQDCRVYKGGVVFMPNAKTLSKDFFNMWQGFAVSTISGADFSIIQEHIKNIICDGDRALIKYFYDWTAYTFQHPERTVGTALVLRGEKGAGKSIVGHFLRKIWGPHGMQISNPAHLIGKFNSHLQQKCFLFSDEAFYSGDKQHEGVLKALITEPTMVVERKGLDAVTQPNYLKIFMATNNDYAVPASHDERRYCVFDVSNKRTGDVEYFNKLSTACNDKNVQSAFLEHMLNHDISGFSSTCIPESKGLQEQRLHSLPALGQWLVHSFSQGYFTFPYEYDGFYRSEAWHPELPVNILYTSFLDWCRSHKINQYGIESSCNMGKYLHKMFNKRKLRSDVRGYYFGTLNEAVITFQKYHKVDLGLELEILSSHPPIDILFSKSKAKSNDDFNPLHGENDRSPFHSSTMFN